jgi:hypothetical protein
MQVYLAKVLCATCAVMKVLVQLLDSMPYSMFSLVNTLHHAVYCAISQLITALTGGSHPSEHLWRHHEV